MIIEIIKFIIYSVLIILISKFVLVKTLRNLAENLNLKPQKVGDIAGYATSMPELLTIGVSSFNGLMGASIYNVISSNIINFLQYFLSILLNKNKEVLKNKAILIDIVLVILTIIIPIILLVINIEVNVIIVPIFFILYLLFKVINNKIHKKYLIEEDSKIQEEIEEDKKEYGNKKRTIVYILILLLTGVMLFFIGDRLGNVLENLCNLFFVPQFFIGILLGVVTSIPELITFFESQKHYKKKDEKTLGVIEATNNLLTSNISNLFIIQSIGILIFTIFIH